MKVRVLRALLAYTLLLPIPSLTIGCHPTATVALGPKRSVALTETQAHLVIEQALLDQGVAVQRDQPAELDELGARQIDFVFGSPAHGVEWITPADRAHDAPEYWPVRETQAPLRVIGGALPSGAPLYVLALDQRSYLYEDNPRWVQRGAPGIDTIEERLRRDVEQFLAYVRAQDPPL